MTHERAERQEGAALFERHRTFTQRGLATDILVSNGTGDALETRALLFSRDPGGRMTGRELLSESGVLATHRWTYDDNARTAENTVHLAAGVATPYRLGVHLRNRRGFDPARRANPHQAGPHTVLTASVH